MIRGTNDLRGMLNIIKDSLPSLDLGVDVNSRIISEALCKLASAAAKEGDDVLLKESLDLLSQVYEEVMERGSDFAKLYASVMLANALIEAGELGKAREALSKAKAIAEGLDGLSGATAIADVAEAMIKANMSDEGEALLMRSMEVAEVAEVLEEKVLALSYVALVSSIAKKFDIAVSAARDAIKYARKLGDSLSGRVVEEISNAIAELSKSGATEAATELGKELIDLVSSFADMEHYLPVLEALGSVGLIDLNRVKEVLNALLRIADESVPKGTGNPAFEASMRLFHYVTVARVAAKVGLSNYSLEVIAPMRDAIRDMDTLGAEEAEILSTMLVPIAPHLPVIAEALGSEYRDVALELIEGAIKIADRASSESFIASVVGPEVIEASRGLTYIGVVRASGKLGAEELAMKALRRIGEVGVMLMALSALLTAKYG